MLNNNLFIYVESSSSGTESSEKKEKMEAKRRKMEDNIGRRIERSVSALGQTLHSCEEQREIRHQQLMELRKRRLQIEETRNHIHRQGIADLVAAVANLSAGTYFFIFYFFAHYFYLTYCLHYSSFPWLQKTSPFTKETIIYKHKNNGQSNKN